MSQTENFEEYVLPGFTCSISNCLMRDPVMTIDGHSYERAEIEKWFENGNNISPVTGSPLLSTVLFPNHNLRMALDNLIIKYPNLEALQSKYSPKSSKIEFSPKTYTELKFLDQKKLMGETIIFSKGATVASRYTTPEKLIDALALISTPLRITPNEEPYFYFEASEVITHFYGGSFGMTTVNPTTFNLELSYLIDDHSWYLDGNGWIHSPDGKVLMTGWSPSNIKRNDRIAVRASSKGFFQVLINDKKVLETKIEIPVTDPLVNFWGFICLTGGLSQVKLLGYFNRK